MYVHNNKGNNMLNENNAIKYVIQHFNNEIYKEYGDLTIHNSHFNREDNMWEITFSLGEWKHYSFSVWDNGSGLYGEW